MDGRLGLAVLGCLIGCGGGKAAAPAATGPTEAAVEPTPTVTATPTAAAPTSPLDPILADHTLPVAMHTAPLGDLRGWIVVEDKVQLGVAPADGDPGVTIVPGEDDEVEDVLARLRAALPASDDRGAWPGTSACGGGKPVAQPTFDDIAFAVRAEPPRAGDVLLVIGGDRVVERGLVLAYLIGRPIVIAVRDGNGLARALPLRLCAAARPAMRVPHAIEVGVTDIGGHAVMIARSTGHARADGIVSLSDRATAESIADAIRAQAFGETPAAARAWIRANVPVARTVAALDGLLGADAAALAVGMADAGLDRLTPQLEGLSVAGAADKSTVRRALLERLEALTACAERAAFEGAGDRLAIQAVFGVGPPSISVSPTLSPASAACVQAAFAGLQTSSGTAGVGTARFVLRLQRDDVNAAPRIVPFEGLHGTGP